MANKAKKSSPEALDAALEKLVVCCPDKRTYDSVTSVIFQLYCGNDYGLGNFNLSLLDRFEQCWQSGRQKIAKSKGIKLIVTNA